MDQVTQHNAALAEEMTAASHTLSAESEKLSGLIGQFRFGDRATETLRRELRSAAPHAFAQRAPQPSSDAGRRGLADATSALCLRRAGFKGCAQAAKQQGEGGQQLLGRILNGRAQRLRVAGRQAPVGEGNPDRALQPGRARSHAPFRPPVLRLIRPDNDLFGACSGPVKSPVPRPLLTGQGHGSGAMRTLTSRGGAQYGALVTIRPAPART